MIKKLMILISLILISIMGVYAGTFSESGGVPTWDGSLMCVDGGSYNFGEINDITYIDSETSLKSAINNCGSNNCNIYNIKACMGL